MRLTDGIFTRTETGTSSWGSGVLKNISLSALPALPALPPSRRERASRAAQFATRVTVSGVEPSMMPTLNRSKA